MLIESVSSPFTNYTPYDFHNTGSTTNQCLTEDYPEDMIPWDSSHDPTTEGHQIRFNRSEEAARHQAVLDLQYYLEAFNVTNLD